MKRKLRVFRMKKFKLEADDETATKTTLNIWKTVFSVVFL